eukprot:TRINITY_DN8509_c1_g1_i1.p1 TRINITY_DN8509_c1_g1~~TRINITY_DN8509_c1_g1_i1.p1  ORF type:complete len:201 (+),score=39.82 TRINITY_DN8509_c1_g1_i1:80-682(+)
MTDVEIVLEIPQIQITPNTDSNFLDFNKEADDLDSDWLMQPVPEADYDSETQCCIDTANGSIGASFQDHYVTKRSKLKKKRKEQEREAKKQQHVPHRPLLTVDRLDAPGMGSAPKGALNNAATRRIACGAMPPGMRQPVQPPIVADSTYIDPDSPPPPPSYHEVTAAINLQRRTSRGFSSRGSSASTSPSRQGSLPQPDD